MTKQIEGLVARARRLSRDPSATNHDLRGAVKGLLNCVEPKHIVSDIESTRSGVVDEAGLVLPHEVSIKLSTREDGEVRICSDDIPGLILSSKNIAGMFRDLPLVIAELIKHNGTCRVSKTDEVK